MCSPPRCNQLPDLCHILGNKTTTNVTGNISGSEILFDQRSVDSLESTNVLKEDAIAASEAVHAADTASVAKAQAEREIQAEVAAANAAAAASRRENRQLLQHRAATKRSRAVHRKKASSSASPAIEIKYQGINEDKRCMMLDASTGEHSHCNSSQNSNQNSSAGVPAGFCLNAVMGTVTDEDDASIEIVDPNCKSAEHQRPRRRRRGRSKADPHREEPSEFEQLAIIMQFNLWQGCHKNIRLANGRM